MKKVEQSEFEKKVVDQFLSGKNLSKEHLHHTSRWLL